jgi:TPR repeat protein
MLRPALIALLFAAATPLSANDLAQAMKAIADGKPAAAATLLRPLAEAGNAEAQLRLALLHYNGHGVKEDERLAVELLGRSARAGNVEAMYQLGNVYTFGNVAAQLVPDPDLEAAKWYHQAAVAGNRDAQYSLGLLFMAGKGVVKSTAEANYWMQQAARAGHPDARSYVGTTR